MNQAVVCIAPDVSEAEKEVETLRRAGFTSDDISVLWPDVAGAQELGYEQHTRAFEGMALGAILGALVGGLTAYLNVSGMLWTPWSGHLVAAGMPVALLAGMGGGGTFGLMLGAIIGLAFPAYEVKKYERKIKVGSTLVAVHTDNSEELKRAEQALKTTGAFGIHHIEERARCSKTKCGTNHDAAVGTVTSLLIILAAFGSLTAGSAAHADEVTTTANTSSTTSTKTGAPISPAAKIDEVKTTMPPDVTSTKVIDSGKIKVDKTIKSDDGDVKTKTKIKVRAND